MYMCFMIEDRCDVLSFVGDMLTYTSISRIYLRFVYIYAQAH